MTTDLSESVTGSTELVFPDDANGQYRLRERTVYDADEVRTELETDIPKYGVWLPVEIDGDDAWLSAPSELRSTLVEDEVRAGELFEIVTMRQDGIDQSDPYEVEVQYPESDETAASQQSLA